MGNSLSRLDGPSVVPISKAKPSITQYELQLINWSVTRGVEWVVQTVNARLGDGEREDTVTFEGPLPEILTSVDEIVSLCPGLKDKAPYEAMTFVSKVLGDEDKRSGKRKALMSGGLTHGRTREGTAWLLHVPQGEVSTGPTGQKGKGWQKAFKMSGEE